MKPSSDTDVTKTTFRVVGYALCLAALTVVIGCRRKAPAPEKATPAASASARVSNPSGTASVFARPLPKLPVPEDVAAPPEDATNHPSGLASKVLAKGRGKTSPRSQDRVRIHYNGWTTDGRLFVSSVAQGQPLEVGVSDAIAGWREAFGYMVEGEKRRLWVPASLATRAGEAAWAAAGDLVFDVELLEILRVEPAPPAPPDVARPPKNAIKTASGLAYRVLRRGGGRERPAPTDTVTFHFSGWTPEGRLFDSSLPRGKPARLGPQHMLPGWAEGVKLMAVGDKYRFWLPAELAYGHQSSEPTAPAGPVVFDIELLEISDPDHAGHEH